METVKSKIRSASHAGTWYQNDADELTDSIKFWLKDVTSNNNYNNLIKAIIGPHAGFRFSGPTAAYSYANINPNLYDKVILLGPCHHKFIQGCGLPTCQIYQTPIGDILVNIEEIKKLAKLENFVTISKKDEQEEHSLEMHLPFIKYIFGENKFTLIPIMVGNLDNEKEIYFGKILSEYLKDDRTLFIISSDFCHWGKDFDYYPRDDKFKEVSDYIEQLDKRGIDLITDQDVEGFSEYLVETENTICGRHPIAVYLNALKYSGLKTKTEFIYYKQSGKINKKSTSSVSYASLITYLI